MLPFCDKSNTSFHYFQCAKSSSRMSLHKELPSPKLSTLDFVTFISKIKTK